MEIRIPPYPLTVLFGTATFNGIPTKVFKAPVIDARSSIPAMQPASDCIGSFTPKEFIPGAETVDLTLAYVSPL